MPWRDVDIRSAQQRAGQNKVAKGFNTTDILGEELADVAIYLLSLAEMTGVDLQNEIEAKMAKNEARVYQRLPNGVLTRRNDDAG